VLLRQLDTPYLFCEMFTKQTEYFSFLVKMADDLKYFQTCYKTDRNKLVKGIKSADELTEN
jgi:hypothetical protein